MSKFSNRSGPFQSIYHRTKRQAKQRRNSPRSKSELQDSTETRFETEVEEGEGGVELKCTSHRECQVRCYLVSIFYIRIVTTYLCVIHPVEYRVSEGKVVFLIGL